LRTDTRGTRTFKAGKADEKWIVIDLAVRADEGKTHRAANAVSSPDTEVGMVKLKGLLTVVSTRGLRKAAVGRRSPEIPGRVTKKKNWQARRRKKL